MGLGDIETPAALLERSRLVANTSRMKEKAQAAGLSLRPHLKTAKCAEVAELALPPGARGITVSTLSEIEFFAERGFLDQRYAVCLAPSKLRRIIQLAREFPGLVVSTITDSSAVVPSLGDIAAEFDFELPILIEIDSGEHRSGVLADSEELLLLAELISAASHLRLLGVLTHGGHSYGCRNRPELELVAAQERDAVVLAAERLRRAGHPCREVSLGSTPTVVAGNDFRGVTELRPGVYTFFDLTQAALGVCEEKDIALSILTTVISVNRAAGRVIVDAGALALSKDQGPGGGYGRVVGLHGTSLGDIRIVTVDQEHGYVEGDIDFAHVKVGDRWRILPNHACITAACHDHYTVVDQDAVVDQWSRTRGF